ncbi:MAG TPA: alpha-amylase family glycosyl hydrolase, partial [Flavisolibacter sp.]|nr:alpha-amylase family glycosyl hydrolase [Flavisolibacter sp.]
MKRLLLLGMAVTACFITHAQLLGWTPLFPKENDAAQNLVITVDAARGNSGLLNYTPTTDVYVHVGVITNFSTSKEDWKHVKFNQNFNQPNAALQATYIGNNKWQFTIAGSLRTYFGVTDATETIQKIAILFRNGNGSKKQANADNSDMYIPVYTDNLALRIDQPATQPKYTPIAEPQNWAVGTAFSFTANANKPSALKLYHNGTIVGSAANAVTVTANSTVMAVGNQQLVAEANDGAATKYDTLNIFVSGGGSPVAALPAGVRDGINYEPGDTSATLVLRAPGKNIVTVIGEFNSWTPTAGSIMNKTPDGKFFWLRLHPLVPGTEYAYQYLVDDNLKIADPYAEKILDPNNNNDQNIPASTYPNLKPYPAGQTGIVSILQTAAPTYNWSMAAFNRPDKRGLVIYELLVRDFVAAHDWNTLRDSLTYLKNLGINAIEVMPFNEFEGNNSWGYNPDFYFAPDKYYGTKNALKEFIDSCHKMGIAVIMDIVLNHTFGPSPLAQLYWDAQNNRPAANNPWYNAVQPHAFGFGADFNHESADTKYFFNRVLQHWISEYKIDGYRFDFSKGLTQKTSTDDAGFSAYDASRIAILNGYAAAIKTLDPNSYIILEHFADNAEEKELSDNGMMLWANVWTQYQEASMGWLQNSNLDWGIYKTRNWSNPHLVTFMESHDEERITYKNIKYGNSSGSYNVKDSATAFKRMELNAAFLLTIPGPKMIWQFGELGYDYSRCYLSTNGEGGDCDRKLDAKPIRWDYLNDTRRKNIYTTYSNLIKLRFQPWYREAFISGTISQSLNGAVKWIKLSSGDTSHLLVIGNFDVNAQSATVSFPAAGIWYDYLENTTFSATGAAQSLNLPPGAYHVYVNRNVNNVMATPVADVPWEALRLEAKAYPNPTTSAFTVDVQLPKADQLVIDLYAVSGQYIKTLKKKFLPKGTHQLEMDALSV